MDTAALLSSLSLTAQLAGATTVILLVLGTPLAWWLAQSRVRWKPAIEAVVAVPLVLPPTVLGFYLLIMFGPHGAIGRPWFDLTGATLTFSFAGLLIGSVIYSLPFVVQPLQNAFAAVSHEVLEAAATLRASPQVRFVSVVLPQARCGFVTAAVLGFTHTVGEFGVVLMIGGNIPGKTQVLSIVVYVCVVLLCFVVVFLFVGGLLVFFFFVLLFFFVFLCVCLLGVVCCFVRRA